MKDYYETLGVTKNASGEEIKKAYRKLAHQYHPDKRGGDEKKFKEINEAYQTLGDQKKREHYDRFGTLGHHSFEGFSDGFSGADMGDLGDIFEDLFGNLGGFGRSRERTYSTEERARGSDIAISLDVTFVESVFGSKRSVAIEHTILCMHCKGTRGEPGSGSVLCSVCRGTGSIHENRRSIFGTITAQVACNKCHCQGKVPEKLCKTCRGEGIMRSTETIDIEIPPGIRDGEGIKLPGKGEATAHGVAGDLYVKIHVLQHPTIRREGYDLVMDLLVLPSILLRGGSATLETLEGTLQIKVPELSKGGDILRIRGKGILKGRQSSLRKSFGETNRGDLLIRIAPKLPRKLSSRARELLGDLEKEGL